MDAPMPAAATAVASSTAHVVAVRKMGIDIRLAMDPSS
jgi:hypothetical protein